MAISLTIDGAQVALKKGSYQNFYPHFAQLFQSRTLYVQGNVQGKEGKRLKKVEKMCVSVLFFTAFCHFFK